jgi:hypothetical protein
MRAAVSQVSRSVVTEEAAQQASWGVKAGGLGLRPASSVALPAHVASLVEACPFVEWLAAEGDRIGVPCASPLISHSARTSLAIDTLLSAHDGHPELLSKLTDGIEAAKTKAASTAESILFQAPPPPPRPPDRPPYTDGQPPALVPEIGEGDPEKPRPSKARGPHLQHDLLNAIDAAAVHNVLDSLLSSPAVDDKVRHRRLRDLAGKHTTHEWLWAINPAHGFVLRPESYRTAIRLRLGLPVAPFQGSLPCAECSREFDADDFSRHALVCARGKRCIGHNQIRDHIAALARIPDPSTQIEVSSSSASSLAGLSEVNGRRPADILTSAAPWGSVGCVAIDLGVTTPWTAEAINNPALDSLDEYQRRKSQESTARCLGTGWTFKPFIISSLGRPHSSAVDIIHKICVAAAKAYGGTNVARAESTWWRNAGTLLMERAARMVECCRPLHPLPPPILGGVDESKRNAPEPVRSPDRDDDDPDDELVSGSQSLTLPGGE